MSEKIRKALKRTNATALAFLRHFNPCDMAEDKAQQWHALHDQIIVFNTAALSPTAAPAADDAERAREIVSWLPDINATTTRAELQSCADSIATSITAAFASIRASQAAEVAALKGELLAVREVLEKSNAALQPLRNGVFNDNGDMTVDVSWAKHDDYVRGYYASKRIDTALRSTAPRAAAIERGIRAQARADMLLEMDTIVAENWPRPVNAIEEMRRRDPTLPRAANATEETNG